MLSASPPHSTRKPFGAEVGNPDVSFCPHAAGEAELTPLRVVAYVTRGDELLVFEHRDLPEAGTQVPAGRLDPGELLEEGLARELAEEVGIEAQVVRELGTATRDHGEEVGTYETHYFHVETDDPREAWEHEVSGAGDDAGLVFSCHFVTRTPAPQLAGNQGEFLHLL
jgi:ADP-ribose pyrophosphatase YjhB (NUDIX family)